MNDAISVLLITTVGNLIFGLAKIIMKSKCSELSCCGCYVKRAVELEEKEAEFELTHQKSSNDLSKN